MSIAIEQQPFVHVVGTIDTQTEKGQILYVNPANVGVVGTEECGDQNTELVVETSDGEELARVHPAIRRDPCDTERTDGLIQHDLPLLAGMHRIRLLYKGEELSVYEAPRAIFTPGAAGLNFGMARALNHHRRILDLPEIEQQAGISYTVMVQPNGEGAWQNIMVGGTRPNFELDANQFPGATLALVRVIRSTGFEDEVIAEERIDLEVR